MTSSVTAADIGEQFNKQSVASIDTTVFEGHNSSPWGQEKVLSHGGYQYTAYWDDDNSLNLSRRDLSNNSVQTINFSYTLTDNDNHDNISLGISPNDGRLHLVYDVHADPINYQYSDAGFITNPPSNISTSQFSGTTDMFSNLKEDRITYPRFFNDNTDKLYLVYRMDGSGDGDTLLHTHDARSNDWTREGKVIDRSGTFSGWNGGHDTRNAYLHGMTFDDNDRLHTTWVYREVASTIASNHDIHYAYSDDYGTTWKNDNGNVIGDLSANDPIDINDPSKVIDVPTYSFIINAGQMALDADNQPHIFTYRSLFRSPSHDRDTHYIHYWRSTDGSWNSQYIDNTEIFLQKRTVSTFNRDPILFDDNNNAHIYVSVDQKLFGAVATSSSGWSDWRTYVLDAGTIVGRGGRRYDKQRWEQDNVLSIPLIQPNGQGGHYYKLKDYKLEATIAPDTPTLSTGDEGAAGIELDWNHARRAKSYTIYRREAGTSSWNTIESGFSEASFVSDYTDISVTPGTDYEYKVTAVNSAGSADSNTVSATADAGIVIEDTFTIVNEKTGFCFRIKDTGNYYMWRVNAKKSRGPYLRPHVKSGGSFSLLGEIDISNEMGSSPNKIKIEAKNSSITTWINGTQVDQRTDSTFGPGGTIGYRQVFDEHANHHDLTVTDLRGETVYEDSFDRTDNPHFDAGYCNGAALILDGTGLVQLTEQWDDYVFETDFDIVKRNAGICFRIQDTDNLYMWQVNRDSYKENGSILQPHVKQGGSWMILDNFDISSEMGSPRTLSKSRRTGRRSRRGLTVLKLTTAAIRRSHPERSVSGSLPPNERSSMTLP
ncbi:BNR repeat-containing protein [Halocatena marina]